MGEKTMITLWEHFGLFVLLSLLVTLVYSGLRQDDMRKIIRLALRRFLFFMLASAVLGVAVYFFALGL
jgi:hypothetical protein